MGVGCRRQRRVESHHQAAKGAADRHRAWSGVSKVADVEQVRWLVQDLLDDRQERCPLSSPSHPQLDHIMPKTIKLIDRSSSNARLGI